MKPKSTLLSFLSIASSALLTISYSYAATYYWDGTTVGGTGDGVSQGGATGAWDTTTVNWDQGNGLARIAWPNDTTLGNTDIAVFGGTAGTVTLGSNITTGGLTFNTTAYAIDAAASTLSFGPGTNTILFNNIAAATISGTVGGTGNVVLSTTNPATAGTLTLNGTSAGGWSGTTTINAGMTLALAGSNQALASTTGGITLNGGGIRLTNVDSTEGGVSRVNNSAITSNGGTFTYSNTSGVTQTYAETIGSVGLVRGQTNFVLTNNMGAGNIQTLTLSGLTRTGATNTSAVTFGANSGLGATNVIRANGITTSTTAGQIVGPWATVGTPAAGQTDYAIYTSDGADATVGLASTTLTAPGETLWGSSTTAYRATSTTELLTATRTAAALRYTAGTGAIALGGSTFNLETYGILNGGSGTLTVSTTGSGGLTTPTGGGNLYLTTGATAITVSAPINDNGGAVTLVKSGTGTSAATGTLTLSSTTSNFSGGIVLNAGTLSWSSDNMLGNSANGFIVNGTATLNNTQGTSYSAPATRSITVNDGAVLTVAGQSGAGGDKTYQGVLSGNGTLITNGQAGMTFSNSGNTFTGAITVNSNGATFASLGDSSNPINLAAFSFAWTGSGKNFASRPFSLSAAGTTTISNNGSGALVIQQPLGISGAAGARTLTLGGTFAAGTNQFAGNITDGTSGGASVVSLTRGNAGTTWALSGTNTYSGATTHTWTGSGPVTTFQGIQALSPTTSLNSTSTISGGANAMGTFRFLDDSATPASRSGVNMNINAGENALPSSQQNFMNLFVGNNSVGNGGTSAGTTTGSTIQVGNVNYNQSNASNVRGAYLGVTGANGYKLQIAAVNVTLQGAYTGNWNAMLRADAPITVTGTVRQATGAGLLSTTTLQLEGSAAGSVIQGNILDSADGTPRVMAVTKAGAGDWTLSGTNNGATGYTGGTTITTGKLLFSGANSLPTTGTVAVGAAGHLSLADGTARNQTVSALSLTSSLANLSFDWTGNNIGDQLTSTADITLGANSIFAVNLNRSGTPAGSVTLVTGGAGSNLNLGTAKFYLANATDYTATLTPTATTLTVGSYATPGALTTIYWQGNTLAAGAVAGVDNAWALSDGTKSNWSSADGTYAATALTPGATANVIFSNTLTGRAQQTTTLGADVTVNSVVIADATAVTIAGTDSAALTLMSTLSTAGTVGGTPGSAITVTSTAANPTISSRVILGANQTWNVASGKTLTVSGVVSGAFSLTKADAGTVILSGANTYTGDTTISGGILNIGSNTAGTLGNGNYTGNILNNGTLRIWSTANQTLTGVISGTGALQKAYGGALTLSGANTYTGKTSLLPQSTAGFTVNVSSFNSVVNNSAALLASSSLGAPTTDANGTIDVGSGLAQAGVTLNYTGAGETTNRILNVVWNGNTSHTISASGTGPLKFTSAPVLTTSGGTGSLILTGTGIGELALGFSNPNTTGLSKTGTGTWILSGASTYNRPTTVSAGTLLINNTTGSGTGSGNVSVTAGTLGGTGSMSGTVTIGNSTGTADSILAPGTSIGAIATGDLTFNSDGRYSCELNGTSVTSDRANVTGTVAINTAASLAVSLTGSLAASQKYFIVVNDDVDVVGGTSGIFAGLAQNAVVGNYGGTNLKISYSGDSGTSAISGGNDIVLYTDGVGGSPYDTWANTNGLTGGPGSSTDPAKSADPDKDGRSNLGEFAFDGNPLSGANDGKIVGKVATVGGNQVMTLTLPVRTGASFSPSSGDQLSALIDGIYYRIEGDVNLSTFADAITEVTGGDATTIQAGLPTLTPGGAWTYRTFRAPGTVPTAPKAFLRAKISETP